VGDIFNVDFQEFIQCLNDAKVEYALFGGYASVLISKLVYKIFDSIFYLYKAKFESIAALRLKILTQ
jgi:hypothetical protein